MLISQASVHLALTVNDDSTCLADYTHIDRSKNEKSGL
jgi:hypothetical protein